MREVLSDPVILVGVLIVLTMMICFSLTGVMISQRMSSLARSIVDVSRSLVIWLIGGVVTATIGQSNPSFKWESTDIKQLLGQALGFTVLVFGDLIFY
jgi:hypothetical protein